MQASRKPRRAFAVPLVLTVAAVPACLVENKQPTRQPYTNNPPPPDVQPQPEPDPQPDPQPDRQPDPQPLPEQTAAPDYARDWTVTLQDDGTCMAYVDVECQKGATCNPPPPKAIDCPEGITAQRPVDIFASAGSWDCYVRPPAAKCPEKATCNPPPPRKTACPK